MNNSTANEIIRLNLNSSNAEKIGNKFVFDLNDSINLLNKQAYVIISDL